MIMSMFRPVWAYREFILGSIKREFQSKYLNSLLGAGWTVINPLAQILVYTVIFAKIMQAKLPGVDTTFGYSIYLCAGVLTWNLFTEITSRAQNMFLDNANLLKKLNFPRLCLPIIIILNALLNFGIVFGLFTLFLLVTGNFPGLAYLALFPLISLLVLFSIGMGIALGVLNVFFRDVGQLFGIIVTYWFWLTPIVYSPTILPERLQPIMSLNPMAAFMNACQGILVRDEWPQWSSLWFMTLLALLLCILGLRLFRKHAGEMVDEL